MGFFSGFKKFFKKAGKAVGTVAKIGLGIVTGGILGGGASAPQVSAPSPSIQISTGSVAGILKNPIFLLGLGAIAIFLFTRKST